MRNERFVFGVEVTLAGLPLCEAGELKPSAQHSARCGACAGSVSGAMLEALRQIVALPDALGTHACEECAHPEMRLLHDGTFHCPACRSEVLPIDASATPSRAEEHAEAYWAGWVDGRFGERGSFADNPDLVRWGDPSERLDYYRGHRAGNKARRARNSPKADDIRKKLFG
jgi:Zn finger protein HypA/HybF involved in hydrogenase expression